MEAKARYDEIADVELDQMMGMPCIKAGGKMIAGIWQEEMVFKLPDEAVREQALALEGAHLFDPSEKGRSFKEWVQVPAAHIDEWPRFADESVRLRTS